MDWKKKKNDKKNHLNKNFGTAINNCYLDFLQMHRLISLVNDNQGDNNLKEILMYVYQL